MADFVFNVSKGHGGYYATLPAASDAIIIVLLKTTGLESDATLLDYDTLGAVLSAANDEADFTGYSRKTLASVTRTVDDTNNRVDVDADDPSAYTNSDAAQSVSKALICYDGDTGAGADTDIVPIVGLDCVVTFDTGVATTLTLNTAGFYRAA